MKQNTKGFSTIALVTAVLVIAALVGVGVYISRSQKKSASTISVSQTVSNFEECRAAGNPIMESFPEQCSANGQTFTNENQQQGTRPTAKQYLNIEEWGVTFELTSPVQDAYYYLSPDRPDHAYLSLSSLKDIEYCGADKTGIAALSRFKEDTVDEQNSRLMKQSYPEAPKIGEYYYYMTGAQAACADDEVTQEKASAARKVFTRDSIKTLQAASD